VGEDWLGEGLQVIREHVVALVQGGNGPAGAQ